MLLQEKKKKNGCLCAVAMAKGNLTNGLKWKACLVPFYCSFYFSSGGWQCPNSRMF